MAQTRSGGAEPREDGRWAGADPGGEICLSERMATLWISEAGKGLGTSECYTEYSCTVMNTQYEAATTTGSSKG